MTDVSDAHAVLHREASDAGYHWLLLGLCTGVLLAACVLQLSGTTGVRLPGMQSPLPEICMANRMFRLPCPGCGLTRSTLALMRGDLAAAFAFNPAGPLMFLLIVSQIPVRLHALWKIRRGQPIIPFPGGFSILGFIVFVTIVQWVVRLLLPFLS